MLNQGRTSTREDQRYLKPKTPYSPPEECEVELFARIKRSSEYYHQGLDQNNKPSIFKIDSIRPGFLCFRLNSNNYASHGLAFYVKDTKDNLTPLSGGIRHDWESGGIRGRGIRGRGIRGNPGTQYHLIPFARHQNGIVSPDFLPDFPPGFPRRKKKGSE